MGNISLLDCTLRDGGYVNDWNFGKACIEEFAGRLADAGIDVMELGFIRDEEYNADRSVFTSAESLSRFEKRKTATLYSAMIEGSERDRTFPVEKLGRSSGTGIDLIRVCTWKRLMEEHIDYCASVQARGYRLSVQPTAIDQYNDEEFLRLIGLVDQLKPYAFYLVDTWGTQSSSGICHYAELADKYLSPGIRLGYHGHNNKMQALSCAEAVINLGLSRDLLIDATVMGMGRGAGNLQTEVAIDFLNEKCGKHYDLLPVLYLYSKYIEDIYKKQPWGYSLFHFISQRQKLSQDFATYFKEHGYSLADFSRFIDTLRPEERIVFREGPVKEKLAELGILKEKHL